MGSSGESHGEEPAIWREAQDSLAILYTIAGWERDHISALPRHLDRRATLWRGPSQPFLASHVL